MQSKSRAPCLAVLVVVLGPFVTSGQQDDPPPVSPAGNEEPQATVPSQDWPSFRGAGARGVAEGFATATAWDLDEGTNVKWQVDIPGLAHSCPVIWGDSIYVTSAERIGEEDQELTVGLYGSVESVPDEGEHRFSVWCLLKEHGVVLWSATAWEGLPKFPRHPKGSFAASTPATDGRFVVSCFGAEGLYCHDVDGQLVWKKDLGPLDAGWYVAPEAQWGFASSPVIHDDVVLILCDVLSDEHSYLAALDLETGEERWRTPRHDVPTWGSPTVDVREGRSQVIVNGWKHIGGYDLETGAELWKLEGGGDIPVPTPIVAHDLIYVTNAHGRMAPILAINADATGTLTMDAEHPAMEWFYPSRGNYMQTPLVYGDLLYLCNDAGILSCYEARTGEARYRERLGGGRTGFTASGVAADGKLYFTSEEGAIHVVKAGPEFEVLAVNEMGETCMASPAISEGVLFFRTRHQLVAIAAEDAE